MAMHSFAALVLLRDPRQQQVLAGLIGISSRQLRSLTNGTASPSYATRCRARDELGIEVEWWDRPPTEAERIDLMACRFRKSTSAPLPARVLKWTA